MEAVVFRVDRTMSTLRAELRLHFPKPSSPELGRLAATTFISCLGSTLQVFAFTYFVYATTKNALATVMVGVAYAVAAALLAGPSGKVAQRLNPRHVCIAAALSKAIIYGLVLAIQLSGGLNFTVIMIASAASGATTAIMYPCWQHLVRGYSAEGTLDETNALFSSIYAVGSVFGALAGGVLLNRLGAAPLFAFNVLSYLPVIFVLARLAPLKDDGASTAKVAAASVSMKAAMTAIIGTHAVRMAVIFTALLELLAWPLVSLLPKIAQEIGPAPQIYGALLASFYVGASLVAVLMRRWKKEYSYGNIIRFSIGASGLAFLLAGAVGISAPGEALAIGALAILLAAAGLALSTAGAILSAITQLGVPEKEEGEVLAAFALITLIFGTIGSIVEGILADSFRIWWLPLLCGALIVIVMSIVWLRGGLQGMNGSDPISDPHRKHLARHAHSGGSGFFSHPIARSRKPLTAGTTESGRHDGDKLSE